MEGAPLSRAVATVDVVDFEALLKANGPAALALLNSFYYPLCQTAAGANGGALLRKAAGTVTLHFPSSVHALKAAARLQTETALHNQSRKAGDPEIRLKIGVALGALSGNQVTEPDRVDGSCAPGGILVTKDVYDQASGRVPVKFSAAGGLFQGFAVQGAPGPAGSAAAAAGKAKPIPMPLVAAATEPVGSQLKLYMLAVIAGLGLLALSWISVVFKDHDFRNDVRTLCSADQIRMDASAAAEKIRASSEEKGIRIVPGTLHIQFRDYSSGCHTEVSLDYKRRSTFLIPLTVHYQWQDTHVEGGRGVAISCHTSVFPTPEPSPTPAPG